MNSSMNMLRFLQSVLLLGFVLSAPSALAGTKYEFPNDTGFCEGDWNSRLNFCDGKIYLAEGDSLVNTTGSAVTISSNSDIQIEDSTIGSASAPINFITSKGITTDKGQTVIHGNLAADEDIVLKGAVICDGMVTSDDNVKLEPDFGGNYIFSSNRAVVADDEAIIKGSAVCGRIAADDKEFENTERYCALGDDNCRYALKNCPQSSYANLCATDVTPEPLEDVHYEFGSIEGMDCTHGCNLLFQKSYENPIVFLMSTIDPDDIVNSVPTKASVATIWDSKKGATIESESMPGTSKSDRMSPIYYFVTEPGKLKFYDSSGSAVYGEAGVKTTDLAQCTSGCDRADDWEDIDYQLGNITAPVIMAQVQGKDSKWATTAIQSVSSTGFDLSLERGRQGPLGSGTKDIAYLVVPEFHGKDEGLQSNIEFYQGSRDYAQSKELKVTKSIGWSCENNKVNLHQNFSKFGVIVNKQSRVGSHGGWLRYCKQFEEGGKPTFTFAFDEDIESLSNRKHGRAESIGYFAFEIPETELPTNVCNLFPEPIQSWSGVNSELTVSNGSVRFVGWSDDYVNRYLKDKGGDYAFYDSSASLRHAMQEYLLLGFDHANYDTLDKLYNYPICDDLYGCDVGNNDSLNSLRKVDGTNITPVPSQSPSGSLVLNAGNDNIALSCGSGSTLCSYQESGQNVEVTIEKSLDSLTINKWGNDYKIVRVKLKNGIYISNLNVSVGTDVELVVPKQAHVTFNKFTYSSGDIDFIFESGSQINIVDEMRFSNKVEISSEGAYPIVYAPNASVIFSGAQSVFKGFIVADYLELNQSSIEGAVTVRTTKFNSNVKINKPDYSCQLPPIPQGELVVTPIQSHVLTCEAAAVEFRVKEKDSDATVTSENGDFIAKAMPNANARWCEEYDKNTGSFSQCSNYGSSLTASLDEGKKTLYLSSNQLNKSGYEVSGEWNGEEFMGSSKVSFVPYKFDVDPQQVVAGKAQSVIAKVMSCDIENSPVSQGYIGEPDIQLDIESPSDGKGDISLLTYEPEFIASENGETQDLLTIVESGQFRVTLSDSSFECSELAGCPESGIDSLSGSFIVKSRPWKFAVCTDSDSSGTSSAGGGFAAAGEEFDVYAKPIRYTDDATICNDTLVTENYLKSDASVAITHTLDTPVDDGSVLGSLNPNSELTKNANSIAAANKGYKFENLKYSEVGSFNFIATETGSFYSGILGGFSGSKAIGRFYPKYFVQDTNEWIVADQNNVAYLSQTYDSAIHRVYPMAAGQSDTAKALNNYRFFSSTLQAKFGVLDDSNVDNDFLLDTTSGAWDTSRVNWLLDDDNAMLKRHMTDNVSRKDRPFNTSGGNATVTNFGLTVTGTDPVSFTDTDPVTNSAAFPVQPPARYGRMALDDIGGNSGATLTIPLRAEFWNGSDFEVNTDDDKSTFNGANYCKQVIWHSESKTTTNASFNGNGTVSDGEDDINASQNTAVGVDSPREQARLWLRMDGSSPSKKLGENDISCLGSSEGQPWLRYNWRQLGDEDPSTVVTFGIYRGNDRVIYRGESGLTGQ
ncbi:DUF6701 domain-containing protein [Vibrio sp. THAF190c]|uniref:DUF6701 domain-containing protein n=1 Tax=Vibrio sp. THAF190c TaxID=2587865 RepID=UPI001267A19C|nr:DUF6701 domain-containing protein [Vibrio sp. THAF190c]QFT08684.1 hypothetical protein FIV04_01635 [Vibrio sp. THAF190c]